MGFNKESAKRVANVTRRIETTPINDIGGSLPRRPVTAGASIKRMILLNDDFGTEQQNGETVNAKTGTSPDEKYYLVNQSVAEGKYWEDDAVLCGKDTSGTWHVLSEGYVGGRVCMSADMGTGQSASGTATLDAGGDLKIDVVGYGDLTGLLTGHEVQVVWDTEHSEFVVISIDDRVAMGNVGSGGFGDYDGANPLGANLNNGSTAIGIFKSGEYVIIGAACS